MDLYGNYKVEKNDIKDALDLVWTVFQEFETSEQGIQEFKNFISYNSIIKKFDNGELCFWGYMDNLELLGVIATRGINHINMLFVRSAYHRQGIAKCLVQTVEKRCKGYSNISNITVNSSPYAVEFYHHLGFIDTDKQQSVNGIRFTPMSYLLK